MYDQRSLSFVLVRWWFDCIGACNHIPYTTRTHSRKQVTLAAYLPCLPVVRHSRRNHVPVIPLPPPPNSYRCGGTTRNFRIQQLQQQHHRHHHHHHHHLPPPPHARPPTSSVMREQESRAFSHEPTGGYSARRLVSDFIAIKLIARNSYNQPRHDSDGESENELLAFSLDSFTLLTMQPPSLCCLSSRSLDARGCAFNGRSERARESCRELSD